MNGILKLLGARPLLLAALALSLFGRFAAGQTLLAEKWDYAAAMRKVAARFAGAEGVVLHVGDSITYANPYGQWARAGSGKTADDRAILQWMHAGADDDRDGWFLARFDHPDGGRSHTAAGGLRADELLAGGKANLPSLEKLLDRYRPEIVVLMIGTNDASAGRSVDDYSQDVGRGVALMLDRGIVPILSTIPPHVHRQKLAADYNEALRTLAGKLFLPLIDYESEILTRRPNDWDGTLLGKGDVHPTAQSGTVAPTAEPTSENLRNSGYLLRGWLSVQKIAEVKRRVIDQVEIKKPSEDEHAAAAAPTAERMAGEAIRLPITRDNWFSNVGDEAVGNNGGSGKLKVKSIQEMSLLDFDPAPLVGHAVQSATLHLHGNDLARITTSTLAAEWFEGAASNYEVQKGSSCFRFARYPDVPWTTRGSDLTAVTLGQGGTIWGMADASPPDADGWQHIHVNPAIVAARAAGISYGILVFDDTGSEWKREGEQFQLQLFPNRFFASRESGPKTAPYLTVALGAADDQPPDAPGELSLDAGAGNPGTIELGWITPADRGPAGLAGYTATLNGHPVPRWRLPKPGKSNEKAQLILPGESYLTGNRLVVEVRALDGAGNIGPPAAASATSAKAFAAPQMLPLRDAVATGRSGAPPHGKVSEVSILDPLDKINLRTGELIPAQNPPYSRNNAIWKNGAIHLAAARNETIGFQLVIPPNTDPSTFTFKWKQPGVIVRWYRYWPVKTAQGHLPDALTPFDPNRIPPQVAAQSTDDFQCYLCEIYVGHAAPPGVYRGELIGQNWSKQKTIERIPCNLRVWDFTLPDQLSFLPEMNCYDLPSDERDYYRLAHEHRTVLNRVPYFQNGRVADGCAPKWDGRKLDWTDWDKRFGPLFDGSAFGDLARPGVPVDCFYLPIHENWPSPMEGNYNGGYWADRAFPPAYRQALVEVAAQTAAHAHERGWKDTLFQFFLNGKNNFKAAGWSRGSSPWLLDEPANFQDYWALRWFGKAFHEGLAQSRGDTRFVFRCDISRPQWQRDALDDVLDYNVVAGGPFRQYRQLVLERKRRLGQIVVEYGNANAVEDSNFQPVAWSIDAWCLGADGVVPWQTIGNADAWQAASTECLFYPPNAQAAPDDKTSPLPSVRLKAFCRGQQDAEYLTLLAQVTGQSREEIGLQTREYLQLDGQREETGFTGGEDAGRMRYASIRPQKLAEWREAVATIIEGHAPKPKRKLVDFRTPPRGNKAL